MEQQAVLLEENKSVAVQLLSHMRKKGLATNRTAGFPALVQGVATNRAAGFPYLAKGRATQRAAGFPGLAKGLATNRAAGFPGLAKGRAANAANGHPNARKAREAQAANGYPSLRKAAEAKTAKALKRDLEFSPKTREKRVQTRATQKAYNDRRARSKAEARREATDAEAWTSYERNRYISTMKQAASVESD